MQIQNTDCSTRMGCLHKVQ